MDGVYFYGDWVVGWTCALKQVNGSWTDIALQHDVGLAYSTFGEDDLGQFYAADYFGGGIYQIQDARQVWTPVFPGVKNYRGQTIVNSNAVAVTCVTPGAVIHYTTNGTDPTELDPVVPPDGMVPITNGATNKAKALGSDLTPSGVATVVYTLQAGTPLFTPPPGPITNNTTVILSSLTPGAVIHFTTTTR